MHIFFASLGCFDANGKRGLWGRNLCDPLTRMGQDLTQSALDWDSPMGYQADAGWRREGRSRMSESLLEEVRRVHQKKPLDLFFSYFYNVHVEPQAIRQIRKLGIPTVNFYCNGAHQFHLVSEIAPAYDFCWVPEQQALPYYRAVGANPLHIQMGADPVFYRPLPGVNRDIAVLFVGQLYADRVWWLSRLLRKGIPMQVHTGAFANGNGRPALIRRSLPREALHDLEAHGAVYLIRRFIRMMATRRALTHIRTFARPSPNDLEMLRLFARSHLVLNFSNVYDGGGPGGKVKAHVRLRDFEVPMCRALYFPQYSDELPLYYDVEKEVVAWRTLDELVAQIHFYLSHPADADQIREAGYRRAKEEHTWEKRYQQLFRSINMVW